MRLAVVACAALALSAAALDSQAGGRRGGVAIRSPSAAGGASAPRVHHFHHRPRVFVGGALFVSPWAYPYYYPGPGYYYPPAEPMMVDPYWYYCPAAAAYYPYVQDCPGGWEPVSPSPAPLG